MDLLLNELLGGLGSWHDFGRALIRLVAAASLGAVVGYQRERLGKPAGLRTHMLVALGSALFIVVPIELRMSSSLPNVLQGVSTGIGFIGAGAILKLRDEHEIHGLTTAASVWMTAAIGLAVGLGGLGIAIVATLLMWIILSVLGRIERQFEGRDNLSNSTR